MLTKTFVSTWGPPHLISFYHQVTCLMDAGNAVDVIYLDFSKVSATICHSKLMAKLACTRALFAGLKIGWMARPRKWC